ncbi:MAG: hypothetical protein PHH30_09180 [Bacteroidales bacterium]|nr:hypothetical protein [Bacteroidales bacterium]
MPEVLTTYNFQNIFTLTQLLQDDFRVYGYKDCYTINRTTVAGLQGSLTKFGYFNNRGYFISDKATVSNYGNWANQAGITNGIPHGFNLYLHIHF